VLCNYWVRGWGSSGLTHLFLDPLKLFTKFGIITLELLHSSVVRLLRSVRCARVSAAVDVVCSEARTTSLSLVLL